MKQHGSNTRNSGEGFRNRLGTKVVAAVATFSLVASMCPGTAALAYADEQLAAGSAGMEVQDDGVNEVVTSSTHYMTSGTYTVPKNSNVTISPDYFSSDYYGNGIRIEKNAKVFLNIEEGATLTVTGANAERSAAHPSKRAVGHAAILLPEGSTLTVAGQGTLNAQGGRALDGETGASGVHSGFYGNDERRVGSGGWAGQGGGGAGAGIGTDGGYGGWGDRGGKGIVLVGLTRSNVYGYNGYDGLPGYVADPAGTLIVTGSATVNAKGGAAGNGGGGGKRGHYYEKRETWVGSSFGTSGGGGGGGGGTAADGVGSGGTGGGGGGGGASANVDGEAAIFTGCDLDDLWGHAGSGGASTWGGISGEKGDEGASNDGDDTATSRKYAKNGGAGGSCAAPKAVAFYTYKDGDSSDPKVTCTSGHGVTRNASALPNLREFVTKGGLIGSVVGGTYAYDGSPHGATVGNSGAVKTQSVSSPALLTQAEGDGAYSGTMKVDSVEVAWSVAYYDEKGDELGSEPVMPGQYAAVVTFTSEDPDYCGDWVEAVTITKRQVAKPAPAELVFECADWGTGEGKVQDAFADLDSSDYEFVAGAVAGDGAPSLKSAKEAGSYQACFRLADPETCQWEGESEDVSEIWVPWSVGLQELDPNDVS